MAWLRSPLLYGALLLFVGMMLRAILATPEAGRTTTADDLRRAIEFQRTEQPLTKLEPRYRPYAIAFLLAASQADLAAIKRVIDAEIEAAAALREQGIAGVMDETGVRLVSADLAMMGLGAALLFRSFAFVLAAGFGAGLLHELVRQAGSLTGAPSELYLAAILAALVWSAVFWAARALYERRLKLGH